LSRQDREEPLKTLDSIINEIKGYVDIDRYKVKTTVYETTACKGDVCDQGFAYEVELEGFPDSIFVAYNDVSEATEVTVDIANENEELVTPEVIGQHGYDVNPEMWLPEERIRELKERARREYEIAKREGYIGSLEDFENELIYEEVNKVIEKEFNERVKEIENKPRLKLRFKGLEIEIGKIVYPVHCPVNIPHYHYYKGYSITFAGTGLHKVLKFALDEEIQDNLIDMYEKLLELFA